ncbi:MAG: C-terminal binding protein [Chloroflexota bacterium]|nr:C-terminal binding protein [Chloroflexota bacterium]
MALTVVRGLLGRGNTDDTLEEERKTLAEAGAEVIAVPVAERARVLELLPRADGLLGFSTIDADMMGRLERCRGVVTVSHGFNHIDLDAATAAGIPVANLFFCHREVANHTVMFLLAATRKLIMLHNLLKQGQWRRDLQPPVAPLYGETIGLIGLGHIGREVARRVRAMDMHVLAYDPVVSQEQAAASGAELTDLDDLLRRSDYVSLHAPSNPSTFQILNERTIGLMKPSAWVFNTARGDLVEERALYRALAEKRIAGAGLDVFEVEPTPPDNPILQLDNVIVTPHAAGFSDAAVRDGQRQGARVMAQILGGQFPTTICNPEVRGRTRYTFAD